MATVYFLYRGSESDIFRSLAEVLAGRGHEIRSDQEIHVGHSWRDVLTSELLVADAVVVLWSQAAARSEFLAAEVGAARAGSDVDVLPVMVDDSPIPFYLQDLVV